MKQISQNYTFAQTSVSAPGDSEVVDLEAVATDKPGGFVLVSNITVDTNAAKTLGTITSNAITITAHGYKTGIVAQVANSGGALPTGVTGSTNYYVIVIDANTIKLASTQANALAGTALTISGGTGTNTITPTALAGATVQVKWSTDNVVWVAVGSATSVAAATAFSYEKDRPAWRYIKLTFAITAGSLTVGTKIRAFRD